MGEHQANKQLVWSYYQQCNHYPRQLPELSRAILHKEIMWYGPQPLGKFDNADELIAQVWAPLLQAIPDLQRRPYHFIAGEFEGKNWVSATGDFIGTFAKDWLGIPATGSSVHFRYGEFHCIENGKIIETRMLFDLLELIQQAGFKLVPESPGIEQWIPGPLAGDGILLTEQDPVETAKSLELIESMIFKGLNKYDQKDQDSQDLALHWHDTMVWHGPVGTGSAYGLDDFKRNAQGPILGAFPDRKGAGHKARIAEGKFAASTGWPSLVGTHQRTFMNWEPTGRQVSWNIMDFWKRDGDKLLENWVLIDLIDAALQSGVDLLARLEEMKDAKLAKSLR